MKTRVAVVYGGRSGEHEISLRSAQSIIDGLDPERYHVIHYFISKEGRWRPKPIAPEPGANREIDVVFPALHGTFGEDGTMQGLFELADLPYVGPGVLGSAVAMDKEVTKRLLRQSGVPVVDYVVQYRGALNPDAITLPFPVFVKPANLGSSVGITKVKTREQLGPALENAAQYDTKVIIERGVTGREFEIAVLGNQEDRRASFPCEIRPKREFYDYEAKYIEDTTEIDLPANLPPDKIAEMQRLAVAACAALELEGMTRCDFLMDSATGELFLNEPNTIPGFTSISMFPKMWEHAGIPFRQLLDELITLALRRHERKRATRFEK